MDSSASVCASPAQSSRPTEPERRGANVSGGTVALTLSLVCHVGLALFAAHHDPKTAIAPEFTPAAIELDTAEFELPVDVEAPPTSAAPASPVLRPSIPSPVAHSVARAAPPAHARVDTDTTKPEPEPEPVARTVVSDDGGPHFKLTVASTSGTTNGSSAPSTFATSAMGSAPLPAASVDTPARLRAGNVPAYTAAALAAGIEANVPLEITVREDGTVSNARGLEHVGYGLDEVARQSVLGYRFTPAARSGRAVAVRMRWLMRFQLR